MKEKLEEVLEKVKNPPSWWWKVLGGLILLVVVLVVKYQMDRQAAELATLKTQSAAEKLRAEQALLNAKLEHHDQASRAAYELALGSVAAANARVKDVEAKEKDLGLQMARLAVIKSKDWDALNKMAGT